MALAKALLKATQTSLEALVLDGVGMGNGGIAVLASLVDQGRMKQLKMLDISDNNALTQRGIITFARAIDARGLPMLATFSMGEMTARGIGGIVVALIKGCPRLKEINLTGSGSDSDILSEVIDGMLEAAGRAGEVQVVYEGW